jgi:hypothetical protein
MKMMVAKLVKKICPFLEPVVSLPYLQKPATDPYREIYESHSHPISLIHFLYTYYPLIWIFTNTFAT